MNRQRLTQTCRACGAVFEGEAEAPDDAVAIAALGEAVAQWWNAHPPQCGRMLREQRRFEIANFPNTALVVKMTLRPPLPRESFQSTRERRGL